MAGPGAAAGARQRRVGRVFVAFLATPCFASAHAGKAEGLQTLVM